MYERSMPKIYLMEVPKIPSPIPIMIERDPALLGYL